jgi:two-component sensor histidine kinase
VDNRYLSSLDELKRTKKYLLQNDCHDFETNIYVDMSYIYHRLKQGQESLMAAKNALKSASSNDKKSLGHIAVAKAFLELDSLNLALPHVQNALKLVDQNNENMINYYKTIFLRTHTELGNHRVVDSLYHQIIYSEKLYGFHRYLFHRYYAKSLMKNGDFQMAKKIYSLALQEIPEDYLIEERVILQEVSDLYDHMKLYSESLRYLKQFSELENEFFEIETKNRISDQTVLLQVAEKEAALELAKRKSVEQDLSIARKNKTIVVGSVIAVGLLLLIFLFVSFNKRIQRKNLELVSQKQKVEQTNQALTLALHEKSLLMKEIHHRVKNHLQFLMCILRIQARAKDLSIEEFVDKSNARLTAIASIHQQLYEISTEELVSLRDYILNLSSDLKKVRDVDYDFTIESQPEKIFVSHQLAVSIGLILNELISNSYKYAFTENNNFIEVKIFEHNERIFIDYQDSGNGAFDLSQTNKNSGLGIIKLLALQIKANINFSNDYSHVSLDLSISDSQVPY